MSMPLAILEHLPLWVYAVFVVLVMLGLNQSRPRTVGLRRSLFMPLALAGLSLAGVASTFGSLPMALLAWAAALAVTVVARNGAADAPGVRFCADTQRFELPGSWVPMVLLMSLFALKLGAGIALALHPTWRTDAAFALGASAGYGLFSGLFLSRALALLALSRRDALAASA